jgi:hypothetical protein
MFIMVYGDRADEVTAIRFFPTPLPDHWTFLGRVRRGDILFS